jgi:hypothetical protein
MSIILLLIALTVLLALAAPRYGVDSRDLHDHPWEGEQKPTHTPGW